MNRPGPPRPWRSLTSYKRVLYEVRLYTLKIIETPDSVVTGAELTITWLFTWSCHDQISNSYAYL